MEPRVEDFADREGQSKLGRSLAGASAGLLRSPLGPSSTEPAGGVKSTMFDRERLMADLRFFVASDPLRCGHDTRIG